ncbi:response regulator transcription factor [Streptococcus sp. E17BB]|uniref:response regulator transcription factor n=1 Tax=Streptococcus sp. E17BB TaxID=3278714 RepID=UPI00359E24E6
MNIFILEDNFLQQTRIEDIVQKILADKKIDCKHFEVYGKPGQLLEDISERGRHQLFLLDIEIRDDEKRGLDVAREIRKLDSEATIAFVTTHSEFMPVSFEYLVSAVDFIDKELPESAFIKRIENVISFVNDSQGETVSEDSFVFTGPKAQIQVPFKDLLYIETSSISHKLILYSKRDILEFYGQLSDILEQEPRLFQCHRSFIVNPYNISSIDRENRVVKFQNGSSCIVSRLKIRSLMKVVERLHD